MRDRRAKQNAGAAAREPDRGRVWKLPPDKAAYLEKQFAAKGNVLVYEGGVFYDAEEWQKKRGLLNC